MTDIQGKNSEIKHKSDIITGIWPDTPSVDHQLMKWSDRLSVDHLQRRVWNIVRQGAVRGPVGNSNLEYRPEISEF